MNRDFSRGGLYENGALDPAAWRPTYPNRSETRPVVGDLVGWRYGGWRVLDVRTIEDHDLGAADLVALADAVARYRPEERDRQRELHRPWHLQMRHELGPLLLEEDWHHDRLDDGGIVVAFTIYGPHSRPFLVVPEPFMACSCHGHIWPCQDIDRAAMATKAAKDMDRAIQTTEPGVCAGCLEPITTRQRTLTFPEESRLVPGAPGPTFHAGRAACWAAAERYERTGRLVDNPDVVRLASCPGILFLHDARDLPAERRAECSAGPLCSGQHGPPGYHAARACWSQVYYAELRGVPQSVRPPTDCGYRSGEQVCLGSVDGSSAADAVAGDDLWNRSHGTGLHI